MRPRRREPTRLPRPWDSPGKNTGVGCHFLLQCVKVKSESEVAQSCPTLSDSMDCSPPGSSIRGIFQARVLASHTISAVAQVLPTHNLICLISLFKPFNGSLSRVAQSITFISASLVAQSVKNPPAMQQTACNAGDSVSRSGRSHREGNSNPLQCSCLGNPMDRGAWWATVHGVAKVGHDLAAKPPSHNLCLLSLCHKSREYSETGNSGSF